jgi:GT2 family glycosyltransferase
VRASIVVLGFGPEPYLAACLDALLADLGPDDEILLVDNGFEAHLEGRLEDAPVRRIGTGRNSGFTGGCRAAADAARGEVLLFVNSDAVVRPGTVDALVRASRTAGTGVVSGCLRLADFPDLVNSAGNPLHYLGLTWVGHCGEPAADHAEPGEVAVATGGLCALRREVWDRLGGFDDAYFAYHEDTDLCVRAWLAGLAVRYEPAAVADHHYEFSRNPTKMYLLERNRWLTVIGNYPSPLLRRVLPVLLLVELPLLLAAVLQGWGRQKLRAWFWLLGHPRLVLDRRRRVQADVTASSADLARLMTSRIEPPMVTAPPGMAWLNLALDWYWSRVLRRLG